MRQCSLGEVEMLGEMLQKIEERLNGSNTVTLLYVWLSFHSMCFEQTERVGLSELIVNSKACVSSTIAELSILAGVRVLDASAAEVSLTIYCEETYRLKLALQKTIHKVEQRIELCIDNDEAPLTPVAPYLAFKWLVDAGKGKRPPFFHCLVLTLPFSKLEHGCWIIWELVLCTLGPSTNERGELNQFQLLEISSSSLHCRLKDQHCCVSPFSCRAYFNSSGFFTQFPGSCLT